MRQNAADQSREVGGQQYSMANPAFQAFKSPQFWSRPVAHDPEETPDAPNRGLTPTVSVSNRDWTLWAARGLFILAWPPIAVMVYYSFRLSSDEEIDIAVLVRRVIWCGLAAACLGTASAVLYGLRQLKRELRLTRELRFPTPAGDDFEKDDATKKPFALLIDSLATISAVFSFALGACMAINTQPVLAALCLSMAILWPPLFGAWRRM